MKTIWLIRHGESAANAGEPTSASATVPLTATGRAQAAALATAFVAPPDRIITSGYLRTLQTAQPTLERFPQVPHEQWPIHEFTYLAAARCQNMTAAERRPLVAAYWERCDPTYVDGAGCDSFAGMLQRAAAMLEALRRADGRLIAVFSHGLFIGATIWLLHERPAAITAETMRRFHAWRSPWSMPNAGIVPLVLAAAGEFTVGEGPVG